MNIVGHNILEKGYISKSQTHIFNIVNKSMNIYSWNAKLYTTILKSSVSLEWKLGYSQLNHWFDKIYITSNMMLALYSYTEHKKHTIIMIYHVYSLKYCGKNHVYKTTLHIQCVFLVKYKFTASNELFYDEKQFSIFQIIFNLSLNNK